MRKSKEKPNLTDVLNQQKIDVMKSINCINIGEIQSFNAVEQTANIQIQIKKIIDTDINGKTTLQSKPLLMQCPVMVLSGGNSYMSMPIKKGDTCIVVFNDRNIDNWFFEGGEKAPNDERLHDLSDGFAIVGIRNLQNAIDDYLEDGTSWKYDVNTRIDMTANLVSSLSALWLHTGDLTVTGDVSDSNVTTPTMLSIRALYNGHTHNGGPVPDQKM